MRRRNARALLALAGVGALVPATAVARERSIVPPRNIDVRTASPLSGLTANAGDAVLRLRRTLGREGIVSLDGATRTPRVVARLDGFLTAPSSAPAAAIARGYLLRQAAVFRLGPQDVAALDLRRDYVSIDGTHHLSFVQSVDGVPVFGNGVRVNVTRDGRIVNVLDAPVAGLPAAVPAATRTRRSRERRHPRQRRHAGAVPHRLGYPARLAGAGARRERRLTAGRRRRQRHAPLPPEPDEPGDRPGRRLLPGRPLGRHADAARLQRGRLAARRRDDALGQQLAHLLGRRRRQRRRALRGGRAVRRERRLELPDRAVRRRRSALLGAVRLHLGPVDAVLLGDQPGRGRDPGLLLRERLARPPGGAADRLHRGGGELPERERRRAGPRRRRGGHADRRRRRHRRRAARRQPHRQRQHDDAARRAGADDADVPRPRPGRRHRSRPADQRRRRRAHRVPRVHARPVQPARGRRRRQLDARRRPGRRDGGGLERLVRLRLRRPRRLRAGHRRRRRARPRRLLDDGDARLQPDGTDRLRRRLERAALPGQHRDRRPSERRLHVRGLRADHRCARGARRQRDLEPDAVGPADGARQRRHRGAGHPGDGAVPVEPVLPRRAQRDPAGRHGRLRRRPPRRHLAGLRAPRHGLLRRRGLGRRCRAGGQLRPAAGPRRTRPAASRARCATATPGSR